VRLNQIPEPSKALSDEDIVYLHEDGTVTRDVFGDGDVIFQDVTSAWRSFCREALGFAVPDWQAESKRAREAVVEEKRRLPETEASGPETDVSSAARAQVVDELHRPANRTVFER
jgi:hypothetical protein